MNDFKVHLRPFFGDLCHSLEVALIRETVFDYDGAIYALVWNDQTYIKKLYKVEDGFQMVSINEVGNPERFISKDDDFRIVGKVVGHFMPVEGD